MKEKVNLSDSFTYKKIFFAVIAPILMSVFSSVYSITDGLFVSGYGGEEAFSGVNLIMPYLMILGGIGTMFGTGGSALISMTLGEKDQKRANSYFSLIVYSLIAVGLFTCVLGYFTIGPVARWLSTFSNGSGNTEKMVEQATNYGRIIAAGNVLWILQYAFQSFFALAERPLLGFVFIFGAGVTNIVLDAAFVVGLRMGVRGAAGATLIGQAVGGIGPLIYFAFHKDLNVRLGKTKFEWKPLLSSMGNGSSEFVTNIASSIVSFAYNAQLLKLAGPDGITAYGSTMYISYLAIAVFMGFSIGISPIVGYHYGAQNHKELHSLLKKSLIIVFSIGISLFVISEACAYPFSFLFSGNDADVQKLSLDSLRIYSFVYLTCGFSLFASSYFTALNNGLISAMISIVRSIVFELLCILILPNLLGINGIWASAPIAEIGSTAMTLFFFLREKKRYQY
jgi:putative MATE family efflux protein